MSDEFDAALDAEVVRRVTSTADPSGDGAARADSRIARLASRLYAGAGTLQRPRMLACLLRPLGPLALVAVASGAFSGFLNRMGEFGTGLGVDELGHYSKEQVFELARFVEQVSPDAIQQFARTIADRPVGLSAFTASVALVLMRALQGAGRRPTARSTRGAVTATLAESDMAARTRSA